MSRFPRSYIKTSFFHIIVQGINKKFIFEDPIDIKYYIGLMYKIKNEHKINIIAYCMMNNHAHILLETEDIKQLSKYMQRLNTTYGKYYNKKYDRVGYVFRDRYKSEGIYSEEHLYSCIKYIYDNPVKAGICNNPEDYPFSNYKHIRNDIEEGYVFIDVDENKDEKCKNVINEFLMENEINLIELQNNKQKLRELLIILKDSYNISLRKIAQEINVNRETLRKIYKY